MRRLFWIALAVLILSWQTSVEIAGRVLAQGRVVDKIVAQVNDDIVTLSDLNRGLAQYRQDLSARLSGDQLEQQLKRAEKDVLDELIRQKLLLQKAHELGFGANIEPQISAAVERLREANKIKDMDELERALAQQGMDLAGLRDQIKKQIITENLVQEFVGSRITLLTQEIERYYKDHVDDFSTPEEVTLSEILIPFGTDAAEAEARMTDIRTRTLQGEAFASLASQYSKGPTAGKGGSIGTYLIGKLNPDIAASVATVKEGEVTAITKTKDSYAIYRVDQRKAKATRPIEDVRDEIRNRMYQQKFNPEYDRFINQLREDAYIQIFGATQ
jgi:peptidyl-prolyl cis-trans isomerase SurA